MEDAKSRCNWAGTDPLYVHYHDTEWGVPVHDDRKLFEFLILEGAQAGLSWITILKRRDGYKNAFDDFDVKKVAAYTQEDVDRLLQDASIIRNRLKVASAINNAKQFICIQQEFGSFDAYQWGFVNNAPIQNTWKTGDEVPAVTDEAILLSKDLKKRGFKFVGPTIMYAHMQAVGMVNDHVITCFRHKEV